MPTPGTERVAAPGFTLIELLVALLLTALIGQAFVSFFTTSSQTRSTAEARIETHHAVIASMDSLIRDVRLAGGICFPQNGEFIALAGQNAGTPARPQDRLTVRFAATQNQLCVPPASLTGTANAGQNQLRLASSAGFGVGSMGYVTNGSNGDFFKVISLTISGPNATLTTDAAWSRQYQAASSSVYTVQEHAYRVDPSGASSLRLQRDRGNDEVFADGIWSMDVRYRKVDNSIVDLPASDAEWRLVKEVLLSVAAQSVDSLPGGGNHRETATLVVKPRNLQP